jgi:hypothetical protein
VTLKSKMYVTDTALVNDEHKVLGKKDDLWVETALGDQWIAACRLAVQRGEDLVIAELRIFPNTEYARESMNDPTLRDPGHWRGGDDLGIRAGHLVPRGGLSASMVDKVGFTAIKTSVHDIISRNADDKQFGPDGLFGALGLAERPLPAPKRSPGRKGHTQFFYARLAHRYAQLCRDGQKNVVARLHAELEHVELPTVRTWINRARELEILTPAEHGRASGELTSWGKDVLADGPAPGEELDVPPFVGEARLAFRVR